MENPHTRRAQVVQLDGVHLPAASWYPGMRQAQACMHTFEHQYRLQLRRHLPVAK